MKTEWSYETRAEQLECHGEGYTSYGIFTKAQGEEEYICHDVTSDEEEAKRLCKLLNDEKLEPEQAKYIVEDYILGKYIVCL